MASPRIPATPSPVNLRAITITPGSRILDVSSPATNGRNSAFSDEGIWKRLRDSGFDEDSIRRRDKAALIAYIAKLEAEVYELQHNMGLLILEKKDYASKHDEVRLSADSAEVNHMRNQAALSSALAEAKRREDNLKKALGVEKECVANIEKALHEMRTECAEVKVAAESKIAEAHSMFEDAQRKYAEAEAKLHSAESLRDEARRSERAAGRKLQEVESREDDLRRRMAAFKSDCDAKEKEIMHERQSLVERQKVVSESQNKLLDGQALLNQREADIRGRSQALRRTEKELEDQKENIAAEWKKLMEQKSSLELNAVSLSEREKAVIEKEVLLNKKEQDMLISLENLASKEQIEVQKLIAKQEIDLRQRKEEFEAELVVKQKLAEEDIETKRRAWELRELDLKQREDIILEKEQDLEVQARVIADKGKDLTEKIRVLEEKESILHNSENEVEIMKNSLLKEREEIDNAKIDLEKSLLDLEEKKNHIADAEKSLDLMKSESSELLILETKLKEEIDSIRAQNLQLEAEAERLKVEKAKFETEWEVIDEKREELRREEERIAGERLVISKFLKDERDSLNLEKEALREQYKRDLESLSLDREAFRCESQRERSEWFTKFQQERADFLLEVECQKRELEDCINKRRGDIESYLKEKESAFEEEKKRELQYIRSLKEDLIMEQERVALALKKLEAEKLEIKLDREQRDKAWVEIQSLIEELQMQRLKLKEQRELLHADREEISSQMEQLKKLEDVKVDSDRLVVSPRKQICAESTPEVRLRIPSMEPNQKVTAVEDGQDTGGDSPPSSTVSWLKKCATLIFKPSPDHVPLKHRESSLNMECEERNSGISAKELMSTDDKSQQGVPTESADQTPRTASEEPKVIHEVPSVDEGLTDLEATKDVHESSVPPAASAGRKRRVDDSVPGKNAVLLNDAKANKKRRQHLSDAPDSNPHCSSTQYTSKENEVEEGEKNSEVSPEMTESGKSYHHAKQIDCDKSVLVENEAFRCVIQKQTVVQEVLIMEDVGEAKQVHEEEDATEITELEKEDPSNAKLDSSEIVPERRTRSKSKQKS
ncbi:protein CROWDED NUCLEI 4-like isoform X2 [Chenopodium quinoa]|uniref:protein CROWDED NUCLEI 4-like isoform X2 n=1 Tax=Chenopodium quinoa TaxID=63459 RepID=UPI000B78944B|nr:protein CROWDED NUCLEI 4-like isoform X2 [Chenopodium quinoa]